MIDFPSHANAGDSLIWLGERNVLPELGYEVRYVTDSLRYRRRDLEQRCAEGPILFHGGGSLGDRWIEHQHFREKVIADFPGRTIVQLPQSLEFRESANIARAEAVFASHDALTLLLRDQVSFARARKLFPRTTSAFCPDMALAADPRALAGEPSASEERVDVVLLLRTDSERMHERPPLLPAGVRARTVDWGLHGVDAIRWGAIRTPWGLARRVPSTRNVLHPVLSWSFDASARHNVTVATRILQQGRGLITDRLHAAVLGALLGLPVVVMDSANGKIRAAYDAYLRELPGLVFAEQPDDAWYLLARQLRMLTA